MARRKTKASARPTPAAPAASPTRIALQVPPETPIYYVNYAEIGFTAHEFSLTAVRAPTKLSPAVLEMVRAEGTLTLDADIQLVIPPTMIPGLIRALSISKDQYEQSTGITIKDVGVEG